MLVYTSSKYKLPIYSTRNLQGNASLPAMRSAARAKDRWICRIRKQLRLATAERATAKLVGGWATPLKNMANIWLLYG
jgi:hypothetical protein